MTSRVFLFVDGAANKRGSGWGVYWEAPLHANSRHGTLPPGTTNQAAELNAIVQALRQVPNQKPCEIWTDSDYAIKCLTVYIHTWVRNGWRTAKGPPVKHQELITEGVRLLEESDVVMHHIKDVGLRAHSARPADAFGARIWAGNKQADVLARQGSAGRAECGRTDL